LIPILQAIINERDAAMSVVDERQESREGKGNGQGRESGKPGEKREGGKRGAGDNGGSGDKARAGRHHQRKQQLSEAAGTPS
jgi:hypothetical protein